MTHAHARGMRMAIVALVLALAGCGSDAVAGDGGADLSVPTGADLSDCPAYNPSSGAGAGGACTTPDRYCNYFEAYCHCNVGSHTWYCCDDGVRQPCPQTPPSGPDCCRAFDAQCSYACVGGVATVCSCTDDAWHCTTMACD